MTVRFDRARSSVVGAVCVLLATLVVAPDAQAGPTFQAPVRVGPLRSEPGIDIAADGTIFVNALLGFPSRSPVWRSTDGGATFEQLALGSPYSRMPGGGDVDIATGEDGRVYHLDLWVGSNSIAASPDHGDTWTSGGPFSTLPLTDRQWITATSGGSAGTDRLYVSYQLIQPPSNVLIARSDDGGRTWLFHNVVNGIGNAQPGQVVADGDFVAVSYHAGSQLWVARSLDGGLTWNHSRVDIFGDVRGGVFPAAGLAMDGDTMAASWVSSFGEQISVAVSHDRGATWSLPTTVSDGQATNVFPWVAVRGDKVGVAWYGADRMGDPSAMPSDARWDVRYAESTDGGATFGAQVGAAGPIKAGPVCLNGLGCASGRELGDFMQLAIHPDGRSMISYVDAFFDATPPGVYVARQDPPSI